MSAPKPTPKLADGDQTHAAAGGGARVDAAAAPHRPVTIAALLRRTWVVYGTVLRVVDADTLEVDLDLGWHIHYTPVKVRLARVNSPELSTSAGRAARARVQELLPVGSEIRVESHALDKYGRVLGAVRLPDGRDLATLLLIEGHAVVMA